LKFLKKRKNLIERIELMAVILELKVVPNAKKQAFEQDKSGLIKCRLKSKPEGGKANEELIKLLSKMLNISIDRFKILRGATSRNKMIKIDVQTLDLSNVLIRLGILPIVGIQQKIK
jgi:uncharacterized protein (TIGR00251 family)